MDEQKSVDHSKKLAGLRKLAAFTGIVSVLAGLAGLSVAAYIYFTVGNDWMKAQNSGDLASAKWARIARINVFEVLPCFSILSLLAGLCTLAYLRAESRQRIN